MKKFLNIDLKTILIVILAVIVFFSTCGKGGCGKPKVISSDTTIVTKHDTTWLKGDTVRLSTKPTQTGTSRPTKALPIPSTDLEQLTHQFNSLSDSFYRYNYFSDSIQLKDSKYPNKNLGNLKITDVISENRINHRDIQYQLNFPEITNTTTTTITNTIEQKKRNQVFIGGGVTGSQQTLLEGVEADLMLKTKKDRLYGISAGLSKPYGVDKAAIQYGIRILFKIGKK